MCDQLYKNEPHKLHQQQIICNQDMKNQAYTAPLTNQRLPYVMPIHLTTPLHGNATNESFRMHQSE